MAIEYGDGSDSNSGRIIQVVNVKDTDVYSTSGSSWVAYTSAQITPKASDSKILIMHFVNYSGTDNSYGGGRVYKSATGITDGVLDTGATIGFSETNRYSDSSYPVQIDGAGNASYHMRTGHFVFLDTAGTTNQITYNFQIKADHSSRTIIINRSLSNPGNGYNPRSCTTTTLLEIAA